MIILSQYDIHGNLLAFDQIDYNEHYDTSFHYASEPIFIHSSTMYFKLEFLSTGLFHDMKIQKATTSDVVDSLHVDLNFDDMFFVQEELVKGRYGLEKIYSAQRSTLETSGSNLYSALVQTADLFDGHLYFNYDVENISIEYRPKILDEYVGYKLRPDFNLTSLSRDENIDEFVTVLHIHGNEEVGSIIPPISESLQTFFEELIESEFLFFPLYDTVLYDEIYGDPISIFTFAQIMMVMGFDTQEHMEFARIADIIPNFDNTIYDLTYFKEHLTEREYKKLFRIIVDDLRKINIKIAYHSPSYYKLETSLGQIQSHIKFLCRNVGTENEYMYTLMNKLSEQDEYGDLIIPEYSSKWIAYKNSIISSKNKALDYVRELYELIGVKYEEFLTYDSILEEEIPDYMQTGIEVSVIGNGGPTKYMLKENTYISSLLHMYGFLTHHNNGLRKRIQELEAQVFDLTRQLYDYENRLNDIEYYLESIADQQFSIERRNLELERAGLLAQIKEIERKLGKQHNGPFNQTFGPDQFPIRNILYYYPQHNDPTDMSNYLYLGEVTLELYILLIAESHLLPKTFTPTQIDYSTEGEPGEWEPLSLNWAGGAGRLVYRDFDNPVNSGNHEMLNLPEVNYIDSELWYDIEPYNFMVPVGQSMYFSTLFYNEDLGGDLEFTYYNEYYDRFMELRIPSNLPRGYWYGLEFHSHNSEKTRLLQFLPHGGFEDYTDYCYINTPEDSGYWEDWEIDEMSLASVSMYTPGYSDIYLYRPRLEIDEIFIHIYEEGIDIDIEVRAEKGQYRPTLYDMYFLLDNPINPINYNLIMDYNEGLYNLIKNYDSKYNLVSQKRAMVSHMYALYPHVFIEGFYENTDEMERSSLLKEVQKAIKNGSLPRVGYNASIIDMSAIEGYENLDVRIGEYIKLEDNNEQLYRLYPSEKDDFYHPETSQINIDSWDLDAFLEYRIPGNALQVEAINYNLRQPENTSLQVKKDRSIERIIQHLISGVR